MSIIELVVFTCVDLYLVLSYIYIAVLYMMIFTQQNITFICYIFTESLLRHIPQLCIY